MSPDLLPAHIAAKIDVDPAGCWLWTGALQTRGYASIGVNGVSRLAHRVVYTALVGDIPEGMEIDHLCRVRRCCNPAHLEAVTPAENMKRARAHITHCPQGHEYTPENTRTKASGQRSCRECARAITRRWYAKKRQNATTP